MNADVPLNQPLIVGEWHVDPEGDRLLGEGGEVKIEPRLMRLLLALASRPQQTVSAEVLLHEVWPDVVVTPDSVYQAVARLRRVLGDDVEHPAYIATIPRRGYRLVAPVRQPVDGGSAPALTASTPPSDLPATTSPRRSRWAWLATGVALVGAAAFVALREVSSPDDPTATEPKPVAPRVVVLPFSGPTDGGADAAVVSGLSADVSTAVESLQGAHVSAHTAALLLTRQGASLPDIGKRLDVQHAVRGEVRLRDDRITVRAELVDPSTERPRWSQQFERPRSAASMLPAEIAAGVARALGISPASAKSVGPSVRNFAAYEEFLRAGPLMRQATPESIAAAREHYQRAIDHDPEFARAYAGLALTWMTDVNFSGLTLEDAVARAQPLVDRALQLEPDSASVHAVQGFIYLEQLQLKRAESHLQRALAQNPNFFSVQLWLGMTAAYDGRPRDAVAYYLRAGQLDPTHFLVPVLLGVERSHVAAYESARRHFATAIELAPDHPNGPWGFGIVAYAQGALDEAALAYERALALNPRRFDLWRQLGWIYLDLGLPGEAMRAFERAQRIAPGLAYLAAEAARVHLLDGDAPAMDRAIRAVVARQPLATDAQVQLALLYAARGDTASAGALAREAAPRITTGPASDYGPWDTFLGHLPALDAAATLHDIGQFEAARPLLQWSQAWLQRLEQQNVWHALEYQSARVLALQGRRDEALSALESAALMGFRRGWWLAFDPAMQPLRGDPRFEAINARLTESSGQLRARYLEKRAQPGATAGKASPAAQRGSQVGPDSTVTVRARGPLVLWVDDRPSNNARERGSMAALGLEFVLATSTEQAIDELGRQSFALVISDMKRGSEQRAGFTLLSAMHANKDSTPLIFYTSSCTEAEMAEAKRRGAVGCATLVSDLMQRSLAIIEQRE
jgi:DNA-binding winged helix-turn-helix (wHTH) protein/tetratricopeptide (TPR) repeat protein